MLPDRAFFDRLAEVAARETLPRFRQELPWSTRRLAASIRSPRATRAAEEAIRAEIERRFRITAFCEEHGNVGLDRENVWSSIRSTARAPSFPACRSGAR